jgi:F0F1-type ATP synthase assembly protein I
MKTDPTEAARRQRLAEINAQPKDRAELEAVYGQVWDTRELAAEFVIIGFMAPFIAVQRKSDGVKGSLEFQHQPRFYFNFQPH